MTPSGTALAAEIQKSVSVLSSGSVSSTATSSSSMAAEDMSRLLLNTAHTTLMMRPEIQARLVSQKGLTTLPDSSKVGEKSFWDDAFHAVTTYLPLVVNALNKDFATDITAIAATITPEQRNSKDFWNTVSSVLTSIGPPLISMLSGGKDYTPGDVTPPVIPAGMSKAFWDDVLSVVTKVAPIVIAAVL